MYKVKFADIGEGLTEGKVTKIHVAKGQAVKEHDPLFEVETDKVTSDIYAPVSGTVANILISEDQDINVGDVVMEIEDGSEENASVVGSTPVSDEMLPPRK